MAKGVAVSPHNSLATPFCKW